MIKNLLMVCDDPVVITHQFARGQAILRALARQMSRQLHGQRTYFFPGGAALIG